MSNTEFIILLSWILFVASVFGLCLAIPYLGKTIADKRRLRRRGKNGPRKIIAHGAVIQGWLFVIKIGLYVYCAVASLWFPDDSFGRQLILPALVFGTALIVAVVINAYYTVSKADRLLDKLLPENDHA